MALLVLILMGSLIGWIATIIVRIEDRAGILKHIAIGVTGALVVGLFANGGAFMGGLNAVACVAALAGASALLAGFVFLQQRTQSE
ncbi:hypothetical protein [Altererythrobacter sp. GH1-8]|uniref:hypothetical protein n=1 Tax=Altererythrobacter sp. GH1-8 TaxID=3349333 RepID=UPI00374D6FEF